jgi:hypothetical protein
MAGVCKSSVKVCENSAGVCGVSVKVCGKFAGVYETYVKVCENSVRVYGSFVRVYGTVGGAVHTIPLCEAVLFYPNNSSIVFSFNNFIQSRLL